jgi:hypothetical protein
MGAVVKQFPDRGQRYWREIRKGAELAFATRGIAMADCARLAEDLERRFESVSFQYEGDERAGEILYQTVGATFTVILNLMIELDWVTRPK